MHNTVSQPFWYHSLQFYEPAPKITSAHGQRWHLNSEELQRRNIM